MKRALALAKKGTGYTSPNPMVGAVLVKNGHIVGEGFHPYPGGPHAEVVAIRNAGTQAKGSTAYVTLEPCCHFGKTPPCSQALIHAGISEVYYAVGDPNPKVDGGGHQQLREAGITVHAGLMAREAEELMRFFFHFMKLGKPYVIAKYAMSLDGRIATATGSSKWITSQQARQAVMHLRHECDAILIGSGTLQTDNPRLTARLPEDVQPGKLLRVVLDSKRGVSPEALVFKTSPTSPTVLFTHFPYSEQTIQQFEKKGVDLIQSPTNSEGRISLPFVLETLAKRNVLSLLVEGGGHVLGNFFQEQLVDEVWAFVAPKIIGGSQAPGPVGGVGATLIEDASRWEWKYRETHGPDVLLCAKPIAR